MLVLVSPPKKLNVPPTTRDEPSGESAKEKRPPIAVGVYGSNVISIRPVDV